MAIDHSPQELQQARLRAAQEFASRDPSWMASRSGAAYSYPKRSFEVPFFGERYTVLYPQAEVLRADGNPAGAREGLILLHYLAGADGSEVTGNWIAYRDLPGAR